MNFCHNAYSLGYCLIANSLLFLPTPFGVSDIASAQAGERVQPQGRSFSVAQIFFPLPDKPHHDAVWGQLIPVGDLENDGMADFVIQGASDDWTDTSPGKFKYILSEGEGAPKSSWYSWERSEYIFSGSTEKYEFAFLKTPFGRLHISGAHSTPNLLIWDPNSRDLIGRIPIPPPPAGLPKALGFMAAAGATDLTNDGYDEIFFESRTFNPNYFVCGLLDGKTHDALWQHYYPENGPSGTAWTNIGHAHSDFNLDGFPDFLGPVATSGRETTYLAVSGLDGSQIFAYVDNAGYVVSHRRSVAAEDLNGDGIADIVTYCDPDRLVAGSGHVRAIDPTNSQEIWTRPYDEFATLFGGWDDWAVGAILFVTNSVKDSMGKEVVVQFNVTDFALQKEFRGLIFLDAETGKILEHVFLPEDLSPWTDQGLDISKPGINMRMQKMGDANRDGFAEFGAASYFDNPNSSGQVSGMMILFSQKTLFLPEELAIGESAIGSINLPGASGMPFQVLASSQFSHTNGLKVKNWDTNLAPSSALTKSLAYPRFGRLDSNGRGNFKTMVPGSGALRGMDIFLRVIIPHPSNIGDLWTQSTLETVHIN